MKILRFVALSSALLLGACAGKFTPTQDHSVAYNVVHSVNLQLEDPVRMTSQQGGSLGVVADATLSGAEAAVPHVPSTPSSVGYGIGAASLVTGLLETKPETVETVIAWVPVSLAKTSEQAHDLIVKTYLEAVFAEVGDGYSLDLSERHPVFVRPGCARMPLGGFKNDCSMTFKNVKQFTSGDTVTPAPYFVPVAEPVVGPFGHVLAAISENKLSLDRQRALALSISKRLPPWMFIYLPGRGGRTTLVLQSGEPLYFVRP